MGFSEDFFRTTPIDQHVGSVEDWLFHQLKGEVDAAFNHRIYRLPLARQEKTPDPFFGS